MGDTAVLLNGGSTHATHALLLSRASLGLAMCRQRAMAGSAGKTRGVRAMAEGSTSSSSSSFSSSPTSEKDSSVQSSSSSSPPVGCRACGRAELESGCNGEGRIQGGLGALPGFDWWPIKAYRPCPAFLESGGRYRRSGQSLNEIAFGRKGSGDDMDVSERLK